VENGSHGVFVAAEAFESDVGVSEQGDAGNGIASKHTDEAHASRSGKGFDQSNAVLQRKLVRYAAVAQLVRLGAGRGGRDLLSWLNKLCKPFLDARLVPECFPSNKMSLL
jgi:hypothetical protein